MRNALLVGAGGMGKAWARNLVEHDVHIAAWVDIRPGAGQAAAAEHELHGVETELALAEALRIQGIDFVVDVSAPEGHCDVTLAALQAGLPVIGEKPMATSMEDARRMVAAADKAQKLYMVSQSRRYDPNITAFKELIHAVIGGVGILNADFYRGPHFGGFRDEMPSPLLLDMAIHTFDQARYLTNASPVSVYAEEFNVSWSWYRGDASANATFEMSNGLRFNYRGSWSTNGSDTSWQADWRACGPNGSARWDGDHAPFADVVERGRVDPEVRDAPSGIVGSLREFLHALETGTTPNGECHDNIRSLAMVFAAVESAAKGVRVRISD